MQPAWLLSLSRVCRFHLAAHFSPIPQLVYFRILFSVPNEALSQNFSKYKKLLFIFLNRILVLSMHTANYWLPALLVRPEMVFYFDLFCFMMYLPIQLFLQQECQLLHLYSLSPVFHACDEVRYILK